jgi:[ribosomal protein S5]-alanine N-acetyltransferase
MFPIETKRLQIIHFSINCLEAAMEGKEALKKVSGYDVAEEWPNRDYAEILPWLLEQWKKHPEQQKWSGLIVHKGDSMIIGEIGGKGAPDENGALKSDTELCRHIKGRDMRPKRFALLCTGWNNAAK